MKTTIAIVGAAALLQGVYASTLGAKDQILFSQATCAIFVTDVFGCSDSNTLAHNAGCDQLTGTYSTDLCGGTGYVNFSPPDPSYGYPVGVDFNGDSCGCDIGSKSAGCSASC